MDIISALYVRQLKNSGFYRAVSFKFKSTDLILVINPRFWNVSINIWLFNLTMVSFIIFKEYRIISLFSKFRVKQIYCNKRSVVELAYS